MVAVRSAHLNKVLVNLTRRNGSRVWEFPASSRERLAETWIIVAKNARTPAGGPAAVAGRRNGGDPSTLGAWTSIRCARRCCSRWPTAKLTSEEVMQESVGKLGRDLIHGVRDMAAIRQLKATHTDSVSSRAGG